MHAMGANARFQFMAEEGRCPLWVINGRRKPSLAIRIFLNMSGSSASEANAVFRTKALIGLGSVAALYQITEGMPGRVTD
jgi:hypothetical protein